MLRSLTLNNSLISRSWKLTFSTNRRSHSSKVTTQKQTSPQIPIIDVAKFNHDNIGACRHIAHQFNDAFTEFGFAVVVNHGVDPSLFDAVYDEAKAFFQQPMTSKSNFDLGLGYGYGGYLSSMESGGQLSGQTNPDQQSDFVESLTIRGLSQLSHIQSEPLQNSAPIFSQDMSDVPVADRVPSNLRDPILSLHDALLPFKTILTQITEMCFGVEPGSFVRTFDPMRSGIRFAYYPQLSGDYDPMSKPIGYGAHADSGGMVILRLDRENPEGTEVFHEGEWIPIPYVEDGLVLNLGTVLSIMTNGKWKAAIHRAARMNPRERLSIVYGAMVPDNELYLNEGERRVRVKDYLDARVRLQRPETDPKDHDLVEFVDKMCFVSE